MSIYRYRAKKKGEEEMLDGLVEAETEGIAVDILEDRGWQVLFLEEERKGWWKLEIIFGGVPAKELVIFARQLSILISAEVPLLTALKDAHSQTKHKVLQKTIAEVASEVEGGVKLSEALSHHPKIFNDFFINIIKSGEMSGRLQEVLLYLADQMEKDYDLKSKIRGAMIYPAFVFSSLAVIGAVMMVFVVPKLIGMLNQSGQALPLSTRIIKGISDFLVDFWPLLILAIVGMAIGIYYFNKQPAGKKFFDNLKLNLPVFGKLFNYIAVVRMTRSLRTLLLGGVDLVGGLKIVELMMDNYIYGSLIAKARETVEAGGSLNESFGESKMIPMMVPQMLKTGEETGKLDEVLDKISQFYTREVNNIIANLMSLLEPVIMVVLGLAVGVMIAAVILPMYQISTSM